MFGFVYLGDGMSNALYPYIYEQLPYSARSTVYVGMG